MQYTVWRYGVLLGRTDLSLRSAGPDMRSGQLETTPEFEHAWADVGPTMTEFFAAGAAIGDTIAELPPADADVGPADRGRQVHEWLSSRPGATRLREAAAALTALGLELRDASGRHLATKLVMIMEVRPPAWVPMEAIERTLTEAREEGIEIRIPSFVITANFASTDSDDAAPSTPGT